MSQYNFFSRKPITKDLLHSALYKLTRFERIMVYFAIVLILVAILELLLSGIIYIYMGYNYIGIVSLLSFFLRFSIKNII
jgi:hypothetical protein